MVIEETTNGRSSGLGSSLAPAQSVETARTELRPKVWARDVAGPHPCLLDLLRGLGDFATFLRLAEAAEVTEDLAARSPLTVLAPTDAAFAAHDVEALLDPEAAETLCDYVERHLVRGAVVLDQALDAGTLVTVDGTRFQVRERDSTVWIEHARLERTPIAARNGVIFTLDCPLCAHMLLPIPSRSRPTLTLSALNRRGTLEGARAALMSLAPSTLQATSSPQAPRPHADALDHGRSALLALAPSKLRTVVEPETTVQPDCHGRVRSG